jgi:hypothetical protein
MLLIYPSKILCYTLGNLLEITMKKILAITALTLLCGCASSEIPSTVPTQISVYPTTVIEFAQRRDLALYCNEKGATYTYDYESCAFTRVHNKGIICFQVRLLRDGPHGPNQPQLNAICNSTWKPRVFTN